MSIIAITPSAFFGNLYTETATGTGNYAAETFIATSYTFTINEDTLEPSNAEIISLGTPFSGSGYSGEARNIVVGDDPLTGLLMRVQTSGGIYSSYFPKLRGTYGLAPNNQQWPLYNFEISTSIYKDEFYLGAYYHEETKNSYLIITSIRKDNGTPYTRVFRNKVNLQGYHNWNEDCVKWTTEWILKNFYGRGIDDDSPKVVRTNPVSDVFARNQTSTLEYNLVDPFDNVLSTSPTSITVRTGTGWGYSESSNSLTYYQGNWRSFATVVFEYEGIEYKLNDSFYPPNFQTYEPGGNSGPAGGNGFFGDDRVNDDLRPLIPSGSVENDLVDAGIFTRYLVTNAQLKEFAKVLFTDSFFSALVKELVELTFGKVYDALISVISYPFAVGELPNITLSAGDIHLGAYDTDVASTGILDKSFSQINWGNVDINEYWGNFLDYAPHTKIQLFLPWGTGFVDIDPNECMGTYLNVVTNIELSKGTCVHVVSTGNGAILGTYNGFCGSQYPITAVDTSGKAITTVTAAVQGAISLGAGATAAAFGQKAASQDIANDIIKNYYGMRVPGEFRQEVRESARMQNRYSALASRSARSAALTSLAAARIPPSFERNGSFAANAASMMPQKPFIIMTWPDQSVPSQYGSHVGYPSNIYENLGRLRGYTEVGAVHLEGINCTEHEREEIMSLLQGGVIL